jgi:hypothetical protein
MRKIRGVLAAAMVAVMLAAGSTAPDLPLGGYRPKSCLQSVYEVLGPYALNPMAVALTWAATCGVLLQL